MARPQSGMLTPLAAQTVMDGLGAWFKRAYSPLGLGLTAEATSVAYYADQAISKIMGDGASNYGIDNAYVQSILSAGLNNLTTNSRYDVVVSSLCRGIIGNIEQSILSSLPSGWSFTSGYARAFDALLTRFNSTNSSVPAVSSGVSTPAGTLAKVADTGGALDVGADPGIKVAWVGAYDYLEGLPSNAAASAALSGSNSGYALSGLTGNVPTGVTKMRIYRQVSGGTGDYFWEQDVAVTAGTAVSVYLNGGASEIRVGLPDTALRQDIQPASWCQCLASPEFAAIYALSSATMSMSNDPLTPVAFQQYGQLSEHVVAANPSNEYLGVGNPSSGAVFGTLVQSGPTFTAGALLSANTYTLRQQGFCGSYNANLQARVTSILNAGGTITDLTYKYYDATHQKNGSAQTEALSGLSVALSAAVGSLADVAVTAGRLVTEVTAMVLGTTATGTVIVEPKPVRSI